MNPFRPPVAIVGMAGVFPSAHTLEAFWSIIAGARATAREVPRERWSVWPVVHAGEPPRPDSVASRRACLIDGFTPELDGLCLDAETLDGLDPMFRLLLHTGRGAWRDAHTAAVDPERAGVIVGSIALPTDAISRFSEAVLGAAFRPAVEAALGRRAAPASMPGTFETPALNRQVCGLPAVLLARALGLGGFAYTLDAACASSLYAVKRAAEALQDGRLDAVICGGLSRPDSLYTQMGFSQLRALSPSGRCAPFDRRADGLVVGEGCGLLVLKRLGDALDHGDTVHGLIAGAGLSNDLGAQLMSPDSEGQLRAMRDAYRHGGWRPRDVDLVECHGTGTPLGDAVEFESMCAAWAGETGPGACVMGSVKSNVGHLLTAAGAAGIIKVLLAMRHETLPPTASFESPAGRVALDGSPFRILSAGAPWPRRGKDTPRRAAVSAFGFGGVNAHLLLEEFVAQGRTPARAGITAHSARGSAKPADDATAVAIVGMGAHFGPFRNLEAFGEQVLGDHPLPPGPDGRWHGMALPPRYLGYRVDAIELPATRFRIPPAELREMLPQQLIMLEVAAAAFDDAAGGRNPQRGYQPGLGVYLGIGLDPDTTNFHFRWNVGRRLKDRYPDAAEDWLAKVRDAAHPPLSANRTMGALGSIAASRLARAFRAGGPSYSVSCEALSGLRALETAAAALTRGDIDTALVGAVDFACDPRALAADERFRRYASHAEVRPFEAESRGTVAGEGAAAVVLKRLRDAEAQGDHIYAVVRGTGAACGGGAGKPDAAAYTRALNAARTEAGWQPQDVDFIETHGSGDPLEDTAEAEALAAFAGDRRGRPACFLGTVKPRIGHAGAASGLASLIRAALCLDRRTLPGMSQHETKDAPVAGAVFHRPAGARYWLKDRADGPRRAVVAAMGLGGDCGHVLLEAAAHTPARVSPGISRRGGEGLFVVSAANPSALVTELDLLARETRVHGVAGMHALARRWQERTAGTARRAFGVGLVAGDAEELRRLIARARDAVSEGHPVNDDGLYYNPAPLGGSGELAFVFPGSGNQYPLMGRELAACFPEVLETLDRENARLSSQFAGAGLWRDGGLPELSPRDAILAHVWFGTLASDVLRAFGLQPDAVIGYSLGESTGLLAARAWTDRDTLFERVQQSALFTDQLAGDCKAARNTWGLSAGQHVDWRAGVVDRPAADVERALAGRRRVYLLIVNSPNECVIGGHREAVEELVRALECGFHPLEAVTSVHCEVAKAVAGRYRSLHLLPTRAPADIRFYSAARGRAYAVSRETAADSILEQALGPFDFTRVIENAYADGVRVFVETGPGRSCSRMIGRILGGKPHAAMAAFPGNRGESGALLRTLARLAAERVPLQLAPLYGVEPAPARAVTEEILTIPLQRPAFEIPAPPKRSAAVLPMPPRPAPPVRTAVHAGAGGGRNGSLARLAAQARRTESARAGAQSAFLRVAGEQSRLLARAIGMQMQLGAAGPGAAARIPAQAPEPVPGEAAGAPSPAGEKPAALGRAQCLRFATGRIGDVLGDAFAPVDAFPTRVRLPAEPLMLVDRILEIDAQPRSMRRGRVVTEHDVLPGAWYLDNGRVPTCIAVEAGQADLFLSGYLGIDFETRGLAVYRLLDARITFHGPLPAAGDIIHYDIRIEGFFRQGETRLFRFHFDASVGGRPLLSMRDGCAGFFTRAELDAGRGIVSSTLGRRSGAMTPDGAAAPLTPMRREAYGADQLQALRRGDLPACFGRAFAGLGLQRPMGIPGGRMRLVDRILDLDPEGGRYGRGVILGEADIRPDAWFLECHFVDDQVMPGTLMYECCLHTLRVYLLRMGWAGEADEFVYEPVPGVSSTLRCRGQVTADTRRVQYEISIRELGYSDGGETPYVIADALMYADRKPIVQMSNMSLRLSGLNRERLTTLWSERAGADGEDSTPVLFDRESILAFAVGKPSQAFGEPYRVFDHDRRIARLPGPPYQFLDRITRIENCRPFVLDAGGVIEARYDVPEDAWYFAANRQREMPFAVLLEVALQPCGWLAAYLGSALASETDLSFRNLGGTAVQHQSVPPQTGELSTRVKISNVSRSGGMIIQNFEFSVRSRDGLVYEGDTYFGFFSAEALRNQVGIRDAALDPPPAAASAAARCLDYPDAAPFPDATLRMVDDIEAYLPRGGRHGEGYVRGGINVNPDAWFFKAHFYQDPVWPGSLGLESFLQLLKFAAADRLGPGGGAGLEFECPAIARRHQWIYRGQVLPVDHRVTVHAHVTAVESSRRTLSADGFLEVDGRVIYQMNGFSVRVKTR